MLARTITFTEEEILVILLVLLGIAAMTVVVVVLGVAGWLRLAPRSPGGRFP